MTRELPAATDWLTISRNLSDSSSVAPPMASQLGTISCFSGMPVVDGECLAYNHRLASASIRDNEVDEYDVWAKDAGDAEISLTFELFAPHG
jgi:hypothetical protein